MKAAWFGKAVLTTRVWTKPLTPWRPLLLSGWNKTLEEECMLAESKALCKRIGPFAKRAFQHASASPPLVSTSPASPGNLSAFQLFVGVLRDQSFREAL